MTTFSPIRYLEGYLPIENHGLIGDGTTATLAGRDGSISWMCVPRFDSSPLFCGILDAARGGSFTASGDLTSRYFLLTLVQLRQAEMLGADIQILGIAPEDWGITFFQNYIRAKLKLHAPDVVGAWTNDLSTRLKYRKADVTKSQQVQAALSSVADAAVLYLALPPGVLLGR